MPSLQSRSHPLILGLKRLQQPILHVLLALQALKHRLICCPIRDQMVDDDRIGLPLPVQSGIGLLVQLQAPGKAEPDDDIAAGL